MFGFAALALLRIIPCHVSKAIFDRIKMWIIWRTSCSGIHFFFLFFFFWEKAATRIYIAKAAKHLKFLQTTRKKQKSIIGFVAKRHLSKTQHRNPQKINPTTAVNIKKILDAAPLVGWAVHRNTALSLAVRTSPPREPSCCPRLLITCVILNLIYLNFYYCCYINKENAAHLSNWEIKKTNGIGGAR